MMDVYQIYNFKFAKEKAIEGFRQALINKGIDNKHKFVDFVLKYYPNKSKSTLEEYYTRRLCNDNEVLKLLHDELKIRIQEVMLPDSHCKSKLNINGCVSKTYLADILGTINEVLYNSNGLHHNSTKEQFAEYFKSLNIVTDIYSYYNYLIQKYINSYLSNKEKEILDLLVDASLTSNKTIYKFIEENKDKNNIFTLYYNNNTLCRFEGKKHYLLDYIKVFDYVPLDRLVDLLCIIPPREKNILFTIYKKLNNEKMVDALNNFKVSELKNIEVINNNVIDTLNGLLDKEVL